MRDRRVESLGRGCRGRGLVRLPMMFAVMMGRVMAPVVMAFGHAHRVCRGWGCGRMRREKNTERKCKRQNFAYPKHVSPLPEDSPPAGIETRLSGAEKEKCLGVRPDVAKRFRPISAAESGFKHADDRVLLSDHLSLPHQNERHYAHGKDAEGEDDAGLCFRCRNMKSAANPFHNRRLLQKES